jgi:hypothetical protein
MRSPVGRERAMTITLISDIDRVAGAISGTSIIYYPVDTMSSLQSLHHRAIDQEQKSFDTFQWRIPLRGGMLLRPMKSKILKYAAICRTLIFPTRWIRMRES